MLSKLKEERKYLLSLFAIVTVATLLFYLVAIVKHVPITYGTDLKPQWFEFYTEFKRLIQNLISNNTLPFYSWPTFLGNNFYASKSYYLMGDIYSYIGLLLNDNFFIMACEITYLKFLVSAFSFYLLLTEFDRKPTTKIICSLAYAFSGWAIFFSGQLVFLSFYSFVPLYILGMERYIKHNKWLLFSLSCALLFSTNWYFFYTLSILSPVYFLYRYFYLEKETNLLFRRIIKLIGVYILGSLLSAFIWLPGIVYILSNPRLSGDIKIVFEPIVYLNLISSPFLPNYSYIYSNNVFETSSHVTREICLWSSVGLLLLVPQFLKLFNKKQKRMTIALYGLFGIIAIFPILDALLHGFSDPSFRWVFIIVITNLLIASYVLNNFDKINKKLLIKTYLVYLSVVVISFVMAILIKEQNITDYLPQVCVIAFSIIILTMSLVLILKKNRKLLLLLIGLEIVLPAVNLYHTNAYHNGNNTFEEIDKLTHALQDHYGEVNETLNALDEKNYSEFYRIFVPVDEVYGNFSHNMSMHYGILGLMTYDSTYAPSFSSMLDMALDKVSAYGSRWLFDIKDNNLMNFLNTKYAILRADMKMEGDNWKLIDDNYHFGYHLYENTNYRPLGTTYSKVITEEEYKRIDDTLLFLDNVIINPAKVNRKEIEAMVSDAKGYMYNINHYDNTLTSDYYSDKDGFMVMTIPYDKGWKIIVDGEQIDYYPVNGGFIGFKALAGEHKLEMYFMPEGFKTGLALTGISSLILMVVMLITKMRKQCH